MIAAFLLWYFLAWDPDIPEPKTDRMGPYRDQAECVAVARLTRQVGGEASVCWAEANRP